MVRRGAPTAADQSARCGTGPVTAVLEKKLAMRRMQSKSRSLAPWGVVCAAVLAWGGLWPTSAQEPPAEVVQPAGPLALTPDQAVAWALQNNPELAALRQQHGIAAAAVVIAHTYPFNPAWEGKILGVNGPESAGITNRVYNEHKLLMDVELRHQGTYRREAAAAALSRTDWEIAHQEVALAARVLRAYGAVLYRREKMHLLEQTVRIDEQAAREVDVRVKQGNLRYADQIVIGTEVNDARAQLASGRSALVPARQELRRALGLVEGDVQLRGTLAIPRRQWDAAAATQTALEQRPDLRARRMAVSEADARVALEVANRFGNPNLGPMYEYDPTRVNYMGVQITLPLPVLNTHRGEIEQRQAERARAVLDLRNTEVLVRQDVQAALARIRQAREWVTAYRQTVLPGLETGVKQMNQLFQAGEPGVDVLRLIDLNRKLLHARDAELDARWELLQGVIDLAAALGDPGVALACAPTTPPAQPTPAPNP